VANSLLLCNFTAYSVDTSFSCVDKCDVGLGGSRSCSCQDSCINNENCCLDYAVVCTPPTG